MHLYYILFYIFFHAQIEYLAVQIISRIHQLHRVHFDSYSAHPMLCLAFINTNKVVVLKNTIS